MYELINSLKNNKLYDELVDMKNSVEENIKIKIIAMPTLVRVGKDGKVLERVNTDIIGQKYYELGVEIDMYSEDSVDYKEWLKSAENDLASGGANYSFEYYNQTGLLSYQALEKGLKAFLVYKNGYYPSTHNIDLLVNLCLKYDDRFKEYEGIGRLYQGKYFDIKYPTNKTPEITKSESMVLMQESAKICGLVEEIINEG